jgi:hypothetical protein
VQWSRCKLALPPTCPAALDRDGSYPAEGMSPRLSKHTRIVSAAESQSRAQAMQPSTKCEVRTRSAASHGDGWEVGRLLARCFAVIDVKHAVVTSRRLQGRLMTLLAFLAYLPSHHLVPALAVTLANTHQHTLRVRTNPAPRKRLHVWHGEPAPSE